MDRHFFSVGKVNSRYYWVILTNDEYYTEDSAVAEGKSATWEEGMTAAQEAAARLGIEVRQTFGGVSQCFYSRYRRKRRVRDYPETAEFQSERYLLTSHYSDWQNEAYVMRHLITRVTPKKVIVLRIGSHEGQPDPERHPNEHAFGDLVSLNRQELESTGTCGAFYTKDALAAHQKRVKEEALERRRRDEEERAALAAMPCTQCGEPSNHMREGYPFCRECGMSGMNLKTIMKVNGMDFEKLKKECADRGMEFPE